MSQFLSNGSPGCCSCATLQASASRRILHQSNQSTTLFHRVAAQHGQGNSVRVRGLSGVVSAQQAQPPVVNATKPAAQDPQCPSEVTSESLLPRVLSTSTASSQSGPATSSSLSARETRPAKAGLKQPVLGIWTAANASHQSQYLLRPRQLPGSRQSTTFPFQEQNHTNASSRTSHEFADSRSSLSNTARGVADSGLQTQQGTAARIQQQQQQGEPVSSRFFISSSPANAVESGESIRNDHSSSTSSGSSSRSLHTLYQISTTHGRNGSSTSEGENCGWDTQQHSRMQERTHFPPGSSETRSSSRSAGNPTTSPPTPVTPTHGGPTRPRKPLHARQLSSYITNSHHTAELARIFHAYDPHGELDAQHISAMLARLPKLVDLACYQRSCSATSHWPIHVRQRMYSAVPHLPEDLSCLLHSLLQRFLAHMDDGKYGVRQLSNAVWVLGKLRIGHGSTEPSELELLSSQTVAAAQARLLDGKGELLRCGKAQDLSNFAMGCTYLGLQDEELWSTLGNLTASKLQDSRLQEVVNLAWCFAQSGMHSIPVFSSIAAHLTSPAVLYSANHTAIATLYPPRSSPSTQATAHTSPTSMQTAVDASTAITKPAARFPPAQQSRLASDCTPLAAYLNEQQLPNLAWAFAKAGVYNPELMDMIASATIGVIRNVTAQGLSNLAWSFATLRHTHPACLDAIVAAVGWKGRGLQGQAIGNIAWAMTSLKHTPRQLLDTLVEEAWGKTDVLKPLGIMSLVVACVSSSRHEPVLFLRLAREALLQMKDFCPATLVRLLWAFAKAGHHYKTLLTAAGRLLAADRSREALGRLQAEELSVLLWIFSAAGPVAAPVARQTALLPLVHRLLIPKLNYVSPARLHSLALGLASAHPQQPVQSFQVLAVRQQPQQQQQPPQQPQPTQQRQEQSQQGHEHPLASALQAAAPQCIHTLPALAVAQLVLALERLGSTSEHVLLAAAQRLSLAPSSPSTQPSSHSSSLPSEPSITSDHRQSTQYLHDESELPAQSHHSFHSPVSVSHLPKQMLADLFSAYCVSHAISHPTSTADVPSLTPSSLPAWRVSALQQLSSLMSSESWLSNADGATLASIAKGCELIHNLLQDAATPHQESTPTSPSISTRSQRTKATPQLLFAPLQTNIASTTTVAPSARCKQAASSAELHTLVGPSEGELRLQHTQAVLLSLLSREVGIRIQAHSSFPSHHLAATLASLQCANALQVEMVYDAWPVLWWAGTQQHGQWSQLLCTLAHLHRVSGTPSSNKRSMSSSGSSTGSDNGSSSSDRLIYDHTPSIPISPLAPAGTPPHSTVLTTAASVAVQQRLPKLCEAIVDRLMSEPGKKRLTAASILGSLPSLMQHLQPESLAAVLPLLHHHLLCALVSMGPCHLDLVRLQLQQLLETDSKGSAMASPRLLMVHALVVRTLERHHRVLEAAGLVSPALASMHLFVEPAQVQSPRGQALAHLDALVPQQRSDSQIGLAFSYPAQPPAHSSATAVSVASPEVSEKTPVKRVRKLSAAATAAAAAGVGKQTSTIQGHVQAVAAPLTTMAVPRVLKIRTKKLSSPSATSASTQLQPQLQLQQQLLQPLESLCQEAPTCADLPEVTDELPQLSSQHLVTSAPAASVPHSSAEWKVPSHPLSDTDMEEDYLFSSLPAASPLDMLLPLTALDTPFLPGFRVSVDRPRESYQGNICVAAVPQLLRRLRAETASRRLPSDIAALISSGRTSGLRLMLGPRVNSLGLGSRSSSEMQLMLVGGEDDPFVEDVVLSGGGDIEDLSRQLCTP